MDNCNPTQKHTVTEKENEEGGYNCPIRCTIFSLIVESAHSARWLAKVDETERDMSRTSRRTGIHDRLLIDDDVGRVRFWT
jgi:hypothetical protein